LGKLVKQQMVVIVSVQAQAKETHIALGQTQSKEIGVVIKTHQTTCRVKNGVVAEVNQ
jgi:hypothetical protein